MRARPWPGHLVPRRPARPRRARPGRAPADRGCPTFRTTRTSSGAPSCAATGAATSIPPRASPTTTGAGSCCSASRRPSRSPASPRSVHPRVTAPACSIRSRRCPVTDRGKSIPDPGFAGDDGSRGPGPGRGRRCGRPPTRRSCRPCSRPCTVPALLAPVVALLGEQETTAAGLVRTRPPTSRCRCCWTTRVAARCRSSATSPPWPAGTRPPARCRWPDHAPPRSRSPSAPRRWSSTSPGRRPVTLPLRRGARAGRGPRRRPGLGRPGGLRGDRGRAGRRAAGPVGPARALLRPGRPPHRLGRPGRRPGALAGRVAAAVAALPVVRRGVRGLEVTVSCLPARRTPAMSSPAPGLLVAWLLTNPRPSGAGCASGGFSHPHRPHHGSSGSGRTARPARRWVARRPARDDMIPRPVLRLP